MMAKVPLQSPTFGDAVRKLRQHRQKRAQFASDQNPVEQPQTHVELAAPTALLSPTFVIAVRELRQHRLKRAQMAHDKDTFKEPKGIPSES